MLRTLIVAAAAAVVVFAPDAHAQSRGPSENQGEAQSQRRVAVSPYLQLDLTALADLTNGGTQAYAGAAAGIDASIVTPRAEAQASYRYEYRVGLSDDTADTQVHSGLARARVVAVPKLLDLEAGALATRVRTGGFGGTALLTNRSNVSQLYSLYAGPSLATRVDGLDVTAFYRFGYSKTDNAFDVGLPATRSVGAFDESATHVAGATVGARVGRLPFGWTVGGSFVREDAGVLDARFDAKTVRADLVFPVSPTVAVVGGVGYEDIESSQRDPLRDAAGVPVVDRDGRLISDPASPPRLAYDESGFIWDTGVMWRPSPRTSLEARVGRRYGSFSFTGSFVWAPTPRQTLQIGVYDGVTTFGQQIGQALTRVPTRFVVSRDPFDSQFNGCVFGTPGQGGGGVGTGTCLTPALQSIAAGTFRSRGITGQWTYAAGRVSGGVAAGYSQRRFFAPPVTSAGGGFAIDGTTDRTVFAQGFVARSLTPVSGVQGTVYANWYEPGTDTLGDVFGLGATGSYYRTWGRRLTGTASLGLYSTDAEGIDTSIVAAAQVGLRYGF